MLTVAEVRAIFIWGAVGGTLPTLGKIAGTYGANFNAPPPQLFGVAIAVALYGFIGAVVSRAIGNPDIKQSLFAGIAAPAIVVSVLTGASDSRAIQTQPTAADPAPKQMPSLISPAYAESISIPNQLAPSTNLRQIFLDIQASSSIPIVGDLSVLAVTPTGTRPVARFGAIAGAQKFPVQIPADATAIQVTALNRSQVVTLPSPLQENTHVRVTIIPDASNGGDFVWALGGRREFGIGALDVKVSPP